jgi:hypothetical protein
MKTSEIQIGVEGKYWKFACDYDIESFFWGGKETY